MHGHSDKKQSFFPVSRIVKGIFNRLKMMRVSFGLYQNITTPVTLHGTPLSYTVLRSLNGEIPVYKVFKGSGRIVNTVVRHVRGDMDALRKDLANICESPVKIHMGSVEVRGIHTWKIKEYFESIGI
jgi:translation initiation factor 1 (eIF-1/SUI1)